MEKNDWLDSRIQFIKALKAPTESQKMLLELALIESPTKQELRQLDAMVRLEKINQKADEARVAAQKVMAERRDEQRKARTRELIELGGIVSMVDFPVDRGTLTGALLWALDQMKTDSDLAVTLKKRGDAFISKREKERKEEAPEPVTAEG
ncbi:conjugal transfer protein TraD [Paraburkholderia ginsengisoli]|uniref:Conjugal transfer protein TraD n=1 Tax=Paraburkholderia ginsengisoli TaxID=311231 RepID=A0A7T4TC50_9BURK|nr:conjugal transfer protein TraD [Paraburkholderia ginsengisoli]QQC67877.1 conjugal transfer protein TraD [Paraburkholderia ginsengisoli]